MRADEKRYARTIEFEREDVSANGAIAGTLATDGEASDGDILSIEGAELPDEMPLLFGHNTFDSEDTVGSWTEITKNLTTSPKRVRGVGAIELEGIGAKAESRQDLAHMVDRGHIRGLSIRWSPIDRPIPRINLSVDHPAFVDSETETNPAKRWGLFFPTWKALEASIVPLGADSEALIGRMKDSRGETRAFWRRAVEGLLREGTIPPALEEPISSIQAGVNELRAHGVEDFGTLLRLMGEPLDPRELVPVEYGEGKRLLIPRGAYDALMRGSQERLEFAFDLLAEDGGGIQIEDEIETRRAEVPCVSDADDDAPEDTDARDEGETVTTEAVEGIVRDALANLRGDMVAAARDAVRAVTGRQ